MKSFLVYRTKHKYFVNEAIIGMVFTLFFRQFNIKLKTQSMIKRNIQTILLFLAVVTIISLVSCDPSKKYQKEEKNQIQDYLSSHSDLNFELKPSGLYYLETLAGLGISPVVNDSAFIRYTGMFLDGSVFDSNVSSAKPIGIIVGQMIAGFNEGVMLMKVGGKSTLLVPSILAYGAMGSYPYISGYTPLLFDIELVRVIPAPVK